MNSYVLCRNDNGLKEQGQDDHFSQQSILLTYLPAYIRATDCQKTYVGW